jgi:hypothetical protein
MNENSDWLLKLASCDGLRRPSWKGEGYMKEISVCVVYGPAYTLQSHLTNRRKIERSDYAGIYQCALSAGIN